MPHCSPHVIVFLSAQMHSKISTLRTKSCFHNFLTINHDTAGKTHMGRQKIQSSPHVGSSWADFLLEKGEGAHQCCRVPGSRSWHTQHPWRGHPSNPGLRQHLLFLLLTISLRPILCYLWSSNNCSVVVLQEQSLFSPGGAICPCWGMQEEGWNVSPALPASLQRSHTDQCKATAERRKDNWNGETAQRGLSLASQGQCNCDQTCSRANLGYQIITAHSWQ